MAWLNLNDQTCRKTHPKFGSPSTFWGTIIECDLKLTDMLTETMRPSPTVDNDCVREMRWSGLYRLWELGLSLPMKLWRGMSIGDERFEKGRYEPLSPFHFLLLIIPRNVFIIFLLPSHVEWRLRETMDGGKGEGKFPLERAHLVTPHMTEMRLKGDKSE